MIYLLLLRSKIPISWSICR